MNDRPLKEKPSVNGLGVMTPEEKAIDYSDSIPDDEDDTPDYEPTYRDGSPKNECWNDKADW